MRLSGSKEMTRKPERRSRPARATLLLLACSLLATGLFADVRAQKSNRPDAGPKSAVLELHSIDQLKDAFERDSDKVRLVALISPT